MQNSAPAAEGVRYFDMVISGKDTESRLRESEARFRSAFDHAAIGMALVGLDGRFLEVNASLCALLGYPMAELTRLTFQQITHPADLDADLALAQRLQEGEIAFYHLEKRFFHRAGHVIWTLLSGSIVRDGEDVPLYFITQLQDITTQKLAQRALVESERRYRLLAEHVTDMISRHTPDGTFLYVSPACQTLLGYEPETLLGRPVYDFFHPEDLPAIQHSHRVVLARPIIFTVSYRIRHRNGLYVWFETTSRAVRTVQSGEGQEIIAVSRDITARKEVEQALREANVRLRRLATLDGLTNLSNHRTMQERLKEELSLAQRTGDPLSLLMLDIDYFKSYNDTFGHPEGDKVLYAVARLLEATARLSDHVARYGGEEFAVIMPQTERAGALVLAERFRQAIAEAYWPLRSITVSVGVATYGGKVASGSTLINAADRALYHAKATGRNRVVHAEEIEQGTPPEMP